MAGAIGLGRLKGGRHVRHACTGTVRCFLRACVRVLRTWLSIRVAADFALVGATFCSLGGGVDEDRRGVGIVPLGWEGGKGTRLLASGARRSPFSSHQFCLYLSVYASACMRMPFPHPFPARFRSYIAVINLRYGAARQLLAIMLMHHMESTNACMPCSSGTFSDVHACSIPVQRLCLRCMYRFEGKHVHGYVRALRRRYCANLNPRAAVHYGVSCLHACKQRPPHSFGWTHFDDSR